MAGVEYVRREVSDMANKWQKIDDACDGEEAIKSAGVVYLPMPKADGIDSVETKARYDDYLLRAQYINFSGRTVEGLSGLIFSKPTKVELPPRCKVIEKNADGSGVDLVQLTKVLVQHVIKKGRAAVFVDYPETTKAPSIAQVEAGDVRPVILIYNPKHIINWDIGAKGGKIYYTLVVFKEVYSERSAGDFEVKLKDQYRVLELVDESGNRYGEKVGEGARYRQRIYRQAAQATGGTNANPTTPGTGGFTAGPDVFPKDAKGKLLDELPFTFVGSVSNDATVDKPPMLDIVNVNIGHYRNSADHEDSSFLVGQPTPVASGIDDEWWKTKLKERLTLGSRATIPLPVGAEIKLVQADPNTMAKDGMTEKQKQIVALGGKLIEEGQVSKTATEDTNDNIAENSVLGNIANNCEVAIKFALEWCSIFTGDITQDQDASDDSIKFTLNKKFNTHGSTAADRAQLLKEYMADAITFEEYRDNLGEAGVRLGDHQEAQDQIKKEQKQQIDFEVERNKALAIEGVGNQPGNKPGSQKSSSGAAAA